MHRDDPGVEFVRTRNRAYAQGIGSEPQRDPLIQEAGELTAAILAELDTGTSEAQLFELGGASATSETRGLDRHWRNARVIGTAEPTPPPTTTPTNQETRP